MKNTIIAIVVATIMCVGYVVVVNAQDTPEDTLECLDDCIADCLEVEGCVIEVACASYFLPSTIETVPYPAPATPDESPYPAPTNTSVVMPFTFPAWLQVILNSIAIWL